MPATPLWLLLTFLAAGPAHPGASAARKEAAVEASRGRDPKRAAGRGKSAANHPAPANRRAKAPAKARGKGAAQTPARGDAAKRVAVRRDGARTHDIARASGHQAGGELERARALLRAVKQDPVRRRYKHEWEKAIVALERAARGQDRAAALLDAARARYALYRFSSDEADRDRALSLARKARSAGARDAATFIEAVMREAGDDEPAPRRAAPTAVAAAPAAAPAPAAKHAPKPAPPAATTPARARPSAAVAEGAARPPAAADRSTPPPPAAPEQTDVPPDTDPVLDRILAQLAEDPAEDPAPLSANPEKASRATEARAAAEAAAPIVAAPSAPRGPAKPTPIDPVARAPYVPEVDLPSGAAAAEAGVRGPIRKIVIDPGHGGHDTGAIGPTRVREKDVVLAISKRLARKLQAEGFEVVLTRDDDRYLALAERTALANAHQGDLFVSIHANAHPRRDRDGVETWVLDVSSDRYATRLAARENGIVDDADSPLDVRRILADLDAKVSAQASRRLARTVQQEMTAGIRDRFGPVRDLGVKSALFYVLLGARMPAVLVETSFISNRAEEKRLASSRFQDEVASALARAIDTFAAQQQRIAAR